jgi:hypothetical protein
MRRFAVLRFWLAGDLPAGALRKAFAAALVLVAAAVGMKTVHW